MAKDLKNGKPGRNRLRFFRKIGIDPNFSVAADLEHGGKVKVVALKDAAKVAGHADGLITKALGLTLTVTGADCFPVYFYDQRRGLVGIAHCGWRGIVKHLPINMIEKFKKLGSHVQDIKVIIGPGIRACHFEVKEDLIQKFTKAYPFAIANKRGRVKVDLPAIIRFQLYKHNLAVPHISDSEECTYCNRQKYFSFRRDKPEHIKAQIAYIQLGQSIA